MATFFHTPPFSLGGKDSHKDTIVDPSMNGEGCSVTYEVPKRGHVDCKNTDESPTHHGDNSKDDETSACHTQLVQALTEAQYELRMRQTEIEALQNVIGELSKSLKETEASHEALLYDHEVCLLKLQQVTFIDIDDTGTENGEGALSVVQYDKVHTKKEERSKKKSSKKKDSHPRKKKRNELDKTSHKSKKKPKEESKDRTKKKQTIESGKGKTRNEPSEESESSDATVEDATNNTMDEIDEHVDFYTENEHAMTDEEDALTDPDDPSASGEDAAQLPARANFYKILKERDAARSNARLLAKRLRESLNLNRDLEKRLSKSQALVEIAYNNSSYPSVPEDEKHQSTKIHSSPPLALRWLKKQTDRCASKGEKEEKAFDSTDSTFDESDEEDEVHHSKTKTSQRSKRLTI